VDPPSPNIWGAPRASPDLGHPRVPGCQALQAGDGWEIPEGKRILAEIHGKIWENMGKSP